MDALKLKIFDVLTQKTSIETFEGWLYNSEEFLKQIDANPLYFDIISINYKETSWQKELEYIAIKIFSESVYAIYRIKKYCLLMIQAENDEQVYQILTSLMRDFDYDSEYEIF